MRRLRIGLLAAAAACAAAAAPAQATTGSAQGCSGQWGDGERGCAFNYDGGSIVVRIGKDSGNFGSVRLESGSGASYQVHLVCDAVFAPCMMGTYSPEDLFPRGTELRCVSFGALGQGRFSCASGEEFGS